MQNKARRSAFLALAEDMFVHPEFTCIKMEFPKSSPLLSGFGNMELELKFFIDHFKPENAAVVESIPSNHGGWWQTNTDGTAIGFGYECRIFALLLCAEMLRRPEKKKLKEVINIDPEEVFRDTSKVPEGWKIVPHNQRIKAGDRFNMGDLCWNITNQPGDKQDMGLTYIRKLPEKKVEEKFVVTENMAGGNVMDYFISRAPVAKKVPSEHLIPAGYEEIFPGTVLKKGDKFWCNFLGWNETAEVGEVIKDSKGFMTYIRKTVAPVAVKKVFSINDVTSPWNLYPPGIPEGWTRLAPTICVKEGDLIWVGCHWMKATPGDIGKPARFGLSDTVLVTIRKIAKPVKVNGVAVPEGWAIIEHGLEIRDGDKYLDGDWTYTGNGRTGRKVGESRLVYIRKI